MASSSTTYTSEEVGIMAILAPTIVALALALSFPFVLLNAWVATKLWNWFPAVYFHLHPISLWMMVGIVYTISTFRTSCHVKDEKTDWKGMLIGWTMGPFITLVIGYLVHLKLS